LTRVVSERLAEFIRAASPSRPRAQLR
jgi:hypothetical protein